MSLWTRVHYSDGRTMRRDAFGIERPYRLYHRAIDALHSWWVNREWRRQHPGVEVKDAEREPCDE